jgi:exodeoxyribonuclease VII large subunit
LPIITGLGHERDFSVLDRVANTSVKTPTAAAEYITGIFLQQSFRIDNDINELYKLTYKVIEEGKLKLHTLPGNLMSIVQQRINGEKILF